MDELIDAFSSSQVTLQHNSTSAEHPHFALYKAKSSSTNQEARRKKFLEAQKLKRYDYASHARKLACSEWGADGDEQDDSQDMDCEEYVKPPRSYRDQLMLSEWLVEIPSDLENEWWLVLCPVGKRCLIVASRGFTKVYAKNGYQLRSFRSKLPGGGYAPPGTPLNVYSLLDCVFNEIENTYYILDVMCWNSHPCFDSETEFRFYWLQAKIDECPEVKEISNNNPCKFLPLPYFECDSKSLKDALWSPLPFSAKLDGLLFYHKKTHYKAGSTPLVGWLKGYMVPEMFHMDVPNSLAEEKPPSYVSMQQHVPKAFGKHAERKAEDEKTMQYEDD